MANLQPGDAAALRREIQDLLEGQTLAVLATHDKGQPHASLVAFAVAQDLRQILIATPRATRKFANLSRDPRVALLVDSRSGAASDFHAAAALTVYGTAAATDTEKCPELAASYQQKYPHLAGFIAEPSCALVLISVSRYSLVCRFQQVMELVVQE